MRELLDTLESHLTQLESRVKIAILIGIPVAILLFFYLFYVADTIDNIQQQETQLAKLRHDIAKNSPKRALARVVQQKRKLLKAKSELEEKKTRLMYLISKVKENRVLLTTDEDFNKFLDDMLQSSVAHNIYIDTLEMENLNKEFIGKLNTIKSVVLKGNGRFLDFLAFLRSIEKNRIMMMANDVNIETNGTIPSLYLHIDFYGVKQ